MQQDTDLDGRRPARARRARTRAIYRDETGDEFPADAREQLLRAVRAVFASWDNPRAQVYRRAHDIPDDLGTAVNVVQMVFGNKGDRSGTGVAFTRDPVDRRAGPVRRVPRERAGRGRRRRHPHAAADRGDARRRCRRRSTSSLETMRRLEEHYRDMQDIEFTVEDEQLYLLQTRSAKRTAAAALKAAVDDGRRGPDLRARRRSARIDPAQLDQLLHPMIDPAARARGRREGPERVARRGERRRSSSTPTRRSSGRRPGR